MPSEISNLKFAIPLSLSPASNRPFAICHLPSALCHRGRGQQHRGRWPSARIRADFQPKNRAFYHQWGPVRKATISLVPALSTPQLMVFFGAKTLEKFVVFGAVF